MKWYQLPESGLPTHARQDTKEAYGTGTHCSAPGRKRALSLTATANYCVCGGGLGVQT